MEILKMEETRQDERGVSLVETLVALLILSFVAVSTLAMFSQGLRLNASGIDYSVVCNVAKDKAEELMSLRYDHVNLTPGVTYTENRSSPDVEILWRVAEHEINAGTPDPAAIFGTEPMASTVTTVNSGNIKVIAVTVNSEAVFGAGRRTVTVQAFKSRT